MESIAAEVAKRRIRLKERFRDFDTLRSGYCTPEQFTRCLAMCQVYEAATAAQRQQIASTYTGADGRFHYTKFLDDLNSLEVDVSEGKIPTATASMRVAMNVVDPTDEELLNHANEGFIHRILATGMEIRLCFQDFDKHRNGCITKTQFERTFPFKVEQKVMSALLRKYTVATGDVNYAAWARDLTNLKAEYTSGAKQFAGKGTDWQNSRVGNIDGSARSPLRESKAKQSMSEFNTIRDQLRAQVQAQQIRVNDFFVDGDKLRCGHLPEGLFTAGIGRMKLSRLHLTQSNLQTICDAFALPLTSTPGVAERQINYVAFVHALEDTNAGAAALKEASSYHRRCNLSESDEKRLEMILDKVRTAIQTRRLNLKPVFQDFDRATKGVYASLSCTRTRFERALAVCGIRLSEADVSLLERKYTVDRPGEDDTNCINYVAFCADVDQVDAKGPESPPLAATMHQGTGSQISPNRQRVLNLQALQDRLMLDIAAKSLRLGEFLQEHDPLRSGNILQEKLATAFSVSGLRVSSDEVDLLISEYSNPKLPRYVEYKRLLRDLDPDAPLDATSTIAPRKIDEVRVRNDPLLAATQQDVAITGVPLSPDDPRLSLILQRIREAVTSRSMLLPPFFSDYDRHHQGLVSATQFERAVFRHRLPCNAQDVDLLKLYYRHPVQTTHVRYRDFIADVDGTELARPHASVNQGVVPRPPATLPPAASTLPPIHHPGGNSVTGMSTVIATPTLDSVLQKLVTGALTRCVRVGEFFRDSDPLRQGSVTANKFAGGIDALGIHLTDAEFAVLMDTYKSTRNPNSVDYANFVRDMDDIEQKRAQGANQIQTGKGVTIAAVAPHGNLQDFAAKVEGNPFLARLIDRLRTAVASRRVATKTVLADFDKLRKGRVTETQFFSGLSTLQLKLSDLERKELVGLLSVGGKDLNYVAFCNLVDQ